MLKIAAALLAAPVVAAAPVPTGIGTVNYAGPPPARFIQEAAVAVLFVAPGNITRYCGEAPVGLVKIACTITFKNGNKVVIMPHPVVAMEHEQYALILAHELGHVASWEGNHPL